MWFTNRHKDKLHHVYVIHNEKGGWFKIGVTYDIEGRLKSLSSRHNRLKVYKLWADYEAFTARFIEHAAICLIKDWGFNKARRPRRLAADDR